MVLILVNSLKKALDLEICIRLDSLSILQCVFHILSKLTALRLYKGTCLFRIKSQYFNGDITSLFKITKEFTAALPIRNQYCFGY